MCGVWTKGADQTLSELSTLEYSDSFSQMKDLGVKMVTLAGGEPFLRKDFFDIVKAAKRRGLKCNVFTNGTLIDNQAVAKVFSHQIDKIIFSIDGMGPVHDSIRGVPGVFEKAIRTLTHIVSERKKRRASKPEIDIHMTLLKENIGALSELNDFCKELGVNFSFQPYSESNELAVKRTSLDRGSIDSKRYLPHNESLRFSEENVAQLKEELARLPLSFYRKLLISFSDEEIKQGLMPVRKCYITRNFMMVDPYGNVFPCTNLDSYIAGNIRELSLSEIWQGKSYTDLRKRLLKNLLPVCAYCCHCSDNLNIMQLIKIVLQGH
jgi:radical SAM protein with 4Fe4S-binding SPASM domain